LAIAQEIGDKWLKLATEAAIALSASTRQLYADTHEGIRLLTDIREVYSETGEEKLWSAELVKALRGRDDSLWADKRLTTNRMSVILKAFDIQPKQTWKGRNRQGYAIEQFTETWDRYLSPRNPRTNAP